MFLNILPNNYTATMCETTKQVSWYSVDSKYLKPWPTGQYGCPKIWVLSLS